MPSAIFAVVFVLAAGTTSQEGPTDDARARWKDANRAYRAGAFDDAIERFSRLARERPHPHVEANLAAAHWRRGARGEAVLHYRHALALAPRDRAVRGDLARLRAELGNPPGLDAGPVFPWIRLDEALLALLIAGTLGAATMAFGARPAWRWSAIVGGFLVAATALTIWYGERRDTAVVLSASTAHDGVGGRAIGTLSEGSIVTVLERRSAWSRIAVGDRLAGWVDSSRIAPLHSPLNGHAGR